MRSFSGFSRKSVKLLMLAHIMRSLKLGKVACTQELLFLVPTPTLPLLLDSLEQRCYIQNLKYIVTDFGSASQQLCIMIIYFSISKQLYTVRSAVLIIMTLQNISQFHIWEEPGISPTSSSKPHLSREDPPVPICSVGATAHGKTIPSLATAQYEYIDKKTCPQVVCEQ